MITSVGSNTSRSLGERMWGGKKQLHYTEFKDSKEVFLAPKDINSTVLNYQTHLARNSCIHMQHCRFQSRKTDLDS